MRSRLRLPEACEADLRAVRDRCEPWRSAETVCAFAPLPGEIDVLRDWPAAKRLALPRVNGETLAFHWIDSAEDLVAGPFGTREPASGRPLAGTTFDLILVPGLAFDSMGGRLGRGLGFYDRFLETATGRFVGVCHPWQIVDAVPREDHDVRMDFLLTPDGIVDCPGGRLTP